MMNTFGDGRKLKVRECWEWLGSKTRRKLKISSAIVAAIGSAYLLHEKFLSLDYLRATWLLPSGIGVWDQLEHGSNLEIMEALLPGGQFCGGSVLRLGFRTRQRIVANGLSFLDGERRGWGDAQRGNQTNDYDEWRRTPAPSSWLNAIGRGEEWDGRPGWHALYCMKLTEPKVRAIADAAAAPSSFWTQDSGGDRLLLIPARGVVVVTYDE